MNPAEFVMTTSIDSEGYFCARLINNSQQKIDNFLFCFSVLSPIKSIDSCSLEKIIGGIDGRIFISTFASNVARLYSIAQTFA